MRIAERIGPWVSTPLGTGNPALFTGPKRSRCRGLRARQSGAYGDFAAGFALAFTRGVFALAGVFGFAFDFAASFFVGAASTADGAGAAG